MTFSTETKNTALSYLLIISNKIVEMIAMKIFRLVEVATQPQRHEESGWFLKVLRGDRGQVRELRTVWVASGLSRSVRSHIFRSYRSFGDIVLYGPEQWTFAPFTSIFPFHSRASYFQILTPIPFISSSMHAYFGHPTLLSCPFLLPK